MTNIHTADELNDAITSSRGLVEPAIDALCDVISETTGVVPDRRRVAYVSRFWLMHLCDRMVFDAGGMHGRQQLAIEPSKIANQGLRTRLLGALGSTSAAVRVVDPYLKITAMAELKAALQSRRCMRWASVVTPPQPAAPSLDKRLAIAKSDVAADASSTLRRMIALTAPIDLVEQHHMLASSVMARLDERVRVIYTANAHQSSTMFRHMMYAQRELGSRVLIHQHGGGYGIDEQHLGEDHDIALSDTFYTWGWHRSNEGHRVRALPTAFPSRSSGPPSVPALLMSLPVTSHFYRLQPFLLPSHVTHVVDETINFVNALSDGAALRVRSSGADPFPVDRLRKAGAIVSVDDCREPGALAASRAQLVIHNYLGTSWLETLAMNVPTVCFYDPVIYRPRETARPLFEALLRVGVLHRSGADAARFVNQLKGDPGAWWNSPDVQVARRALVVRHANFSDNWRDVWQAEFERLLAE